MATIETQHALIAAGAKPAIDIWRYRLPSGDATQEFPNEGWGIFLIDSTGYFSVVSDYGNYAFRWTSFGDDFREFLCSADTGYLMGKLAPCSRHIDVQATGNRIRSYILQQRRQKHMGAELAREEWYLVDEYLSDDDPCCFQLWCSVTTIEEGWEHIVETTDHDVVAFAERLWPRMVEAMKKDLGGPADRRPAKEASNDPCETESGLGILEDAHRPTLEHAQQRAERAEAAETTYRVALRRVADAIGARITREAWSEMSPATAQDVAEQVEYAIREERTCSVCEITSTVTSGWVINDEYCLCPSPSCDAAWKSDRFQAVMARIVELQRKLADGQDTLGHALASSLRQAYEDRRRLQLQADCAAGDTNGHITDEYGDCVHWCPKCGTPCEHGNNSLECQECRDVDKLTVAPDGVSLETLHRCMPPDAPLLPAPSFDQAIGRFQQWLRNNHDDRRFVVSGVNYKAVTRPDGVLDSHGMAALMSALADLEEWDPSRSGQPVGEAASQFLRHAYARISELEERSEKRSEDVPDGAPERVCVFQKAGWQHYGWTDHNMQVVLDVDGSDMGLEEARYIRADVHDRICDAWAESDKRLKGLIAERDERVETDRRALRAVVNSACEQFKVLVEASKKATIPMTNKRGIGDAMNNLRDALEKVAQNLEGNGEN